MWLRPSVLLLISLSFSLSEAYAQSVMQSHYAVFSSISTNDSLAIAGGQILTKIGEDPLVFHGYYPLNQSLLSVEEVLSAGDFAVFPNPMRDIFTLQLPPDSHEPYVIDVYGIDGKFIQSVRTSDSIIQIDMSTCATGIYYVHVAIPSGRLFSQIIYKVD